MRLSAQAKGGFYPTPPNVVDLVAGLVHVPSSYYGCRETVRILDPCCGAGEALTRLADRLSGPGAVPVETFGVELHADRAEQARERLDRTLAVDLFNTSIANGAFRECCSSTRHTITTQVRRSGSNTGFSFTPPGTSQRAACSSSSSPENASPSRRGTWPPTTAGSGAGPSPSPNGRPSTRSCSWATARPSRTTDPHAEEQIREWADGEPETLAAHRYPIYTAATTPAGDILFATRTVDPVAAAAEARRSGLWTSPRSRTRCGPRVTSAPDR